ncbi:hypothetical protein STEG23_034588, partial [Scotinomys teguina]
MQSHGLPGEGVTPSAALDILVTGSAHWWRVKHDPLWNKEIATRGSSTAPAALTFPLHSRHLLVSGEIASMGKQGVSGFRGKEEEKPSIQVEQSREAIDISAGKPSWRRGAELSCNGSLGEEQDCHILWETIPHQNTASGIARLPHKSGYRSLHSCSQDISMSEDLGDKDLMPTKRKTVWRTAEERRMSDLTRVLEWLERRQGKKKRALQKKVDRAEEKAVKKTTGPKKKPDKDTHKVTFNKNQDPNASKKPPTSSHKGGYVKDKGKRLSTMSTTFSRDGLKKP